MRKCSGILPLCENYTYLCDVMDCTHPILVTEIFHHNSLVTREAAMLLIEKIKASNCNSIEIDFLGITFISRSFADQFHKEKLKLWAAGEKTVLVKNVHNDVHLMLNAVSKTQIEKGRVFVEYPTFQFENRRSLKEYLMSI